MKIEGTIRRGRCQFTESIAHKVGKSAGVRKYAREGKNMENNGLITKNKEVRANPPC